MRPDGPTFDMVGPIGARDAGVGLKELRRVIQPTARLVQVPSVSSPALVVMANAAGDSAGVRATGNSRGSDQQTTITSIMRGASLKHGGGKEGAGHRRLSVSSTRTARSSTVSASAPRDPT